MLMALKFSVPCVPHNGAMGLTELTSHLSTIDYIAISGRKSMLENADSHRENLRHPSRIVDAHYVTPLDPGTPKRRSLRVVKQLDQLGPSGEERQAVSA